MNTTKSPDYLLNNSKSPDQLLLNNTKTPEN